MHTQKKKDTFWKNHAKVRKNRMIYRVLGWFIYPFIKRTKVRKKMKEGKNSWWTTRLWYMLNDDELNRYKVDYDVRMVREKKPHYNLDTSWGRFRASYWFNALRNAAYNYIMTHSPVKVIASNYAKLKFAIDNIYQGEKKVNPLLRAEWYIKEGNIDYKKSKVGEGEVWYHPNGNEEISQCRYSKAYIQKILWWNVYITKQKGEFNAGRKYDSIFHIDLIEKR